MGNPIISLVGILNVFITVFFLVRHLVTKRSHATEEKKGITIQCGTSGEKVMGRGRSAKKAKKKATLSNKILYMI